MATQRPVALVTGGGTGIGAAVVVALAKAGHDVAINYSRSEGPAKKVAQEAANAGAKAITIRCDVSDDKSVRTMLAEVEKTFGRLDVLINNAGTTADWKPRDLESISAEEWDRVFAVNTKSIFLVTRAAVKMLKASKGCIVNTASIVGLRPGPQPLPYAASKAAVVNMTKTLAWNLGPDIRVNAVAPGWMEGDWMERMLGERYRELMDRRAKMTPLRRCVTAEDVAQTMLTFVNSNRFVTGEILVIDGGFTSST